MDINQSRFTWNREMSMEDPSLHDNQNLFNSILPSFPLQTRHVLPFSSQMPLSTLLCDQIGRQVEEEEEDEPEEELGAMKEMMYKIASMQPVDIDPATIQKPKRRNIRISDDPQSVAARHRRERISEKIRILQRLVPGGTKMDTASMLDEAIRYVKFLKKQIRLLQSNNNQNTTTTNIGENWQAKSSLTSSTSLDPNPTGHVFTLGENATDHLCFNHEVISD